MDHPPDGIDFHGLNSELLHSPDGCDLAAPEPSGNIREVSIDERTFGIRLADTDEGRNLANLLVDKMYAWRGYTVSQEMEGDPNRITLAAANNGVVMGTVTLGIDSTGGILADEVFKDQVDLYRSRGAKVCEITKLAIDPNVRSKTVLAALFHILFIYGRHLHRCTDVFVEVNPRHRRFYERMLGFKPQTEARENPRVNAPAYLLWLSLDYVADQIEKLGGTNNHPDTERSLYPFFFSPQEEKWLKQHAKSSLYAGTLNAC